MGEAVAGVARLPVTTLSLIVTVAPAPLSVTLTSMLIPPAKVPGPIVIVSPSCAASTAAWIVAKHDAGLVPTHTDPAIARPALAPAPAAAMAAMTPATINLSVYMV